MRWLIAEDEGDIRMLIATMCRIWGHEPIVFENGQKVWDWLDGVEAGEKREQLPDLVLMDIRMPGKRGNEIARRMRTIPTFERKPIVLMTAFALNQGERDTMIASDGVDHIIGKPLPDFEELRSLLLDITKAK